jgi:hypothetical protein
VTSGMTMLAFLLIVLVAAVLLFAVVAGPNRRGRRGSGRGGSGRHSSGRGPSYTAAPRLDRAAVADRWSTIGAMAAGGGNGLRQAISEADKLLDLALRQQVSGDTMGERLKAARPRFSDYAAYDAAWRAHKLRNALAHEVGFDLVPSQAREALADFERALRQLGAL